MTEILFSEKHLSESVCHGCKHAQCGENSTDSRAAQRKTAVCCAVSFALRTPSGSPSRDCKQGGTVGKRSPLRDTGVSAFLLLCSNEKLKMES